MDTLNRPELEADTVQVRRLRPADLETVIALDARNTGRRREEFFRVKLEQAIAHAELDISLAADVDGQLVGYLIARVYYGEYGSMESTAMLDSLGVHPDFRGRGVGHELVRQLRTNLLGLGVRTLSTVGDWNGQHMLTFFQREGFRPAPRICLDMDLEEARRTEHTIA